MRDLGRNEVTVETRTISPEEAKAILKNNRNNRSLRKTRVEAYARDMRGGRWHLNGDPIRFNGSGGLADGQHRLYACVVADTPFETVVIHGLDNAAHKTIDVGLQRSFADQLRWEGEKHYQLLSAVLGIVWRYDNDAISKAYPVPTRSELLVYLERNPEVRESLDLNRRAVSQSGIRLNALCATDFLMAREHGRNVADEFVEWVLGGVGYTEGDPALALRNLATKMSRMTRPDLTEWLAYCVKAANAWLLGQAVRNIRWRRVGAQREPFPKLLTKSQLTGEFDDPA